MVSSSGAIRCFDTVSLSQKLSLHRHTRVPILVHVFLWDRSMNYANVGSIRARAMSTCPPPSPAPPETQYLAPPPPGNESRVVPLAVEDDSDDDFEISMDDGRSITQERDTAGDFSFRLRDFACQDSWV